MTLEREILCGNGQVKGWHLAAHEWITGKREMGLGVLTGTRLKMESGVLVMGMVAPLSPCRSVPNEAAPKQSELI